MSIVFYKSYFTTVGSKDTLECIYIENDFAHIIIHENKSPLGKIRVSYFYNEKYFKDNLAFDKNEEEKIGDIDLIIGSFATWIDTEKLINILINFKKENKINKHKDKFKDARCEELFEETIDYLMNIYKRS